MVAPEYESVATAVAEVLRGLPGPGLTEEESQAAESTPRDVLAEVVKPEPDQGLVRRGLAALRGFLAPVLLGAQLGAKKWGRGVDASGDRVAGLGPLNLVLRLAQQVEDSATEHRRSPAGVHLDIACTPHPTWLPN
jgi:hypothetical protein